MAPSEESISQSIEEAAESDAEKGKAYRESDPRSRQRTQEAFNDLLREERKDRQQARKQREKYASRIFWLICAWLTSVFSLLVAQGSTGYYIAPSILITYIGATTANVLGIFWLVANDLFPGDGDMSIPEPFDPQSYGDR